MKRLIFILAALLMAGSVCAEEYLYIDDITISAEDAAAGATVVAPVKAHFDYYVSSFMVIFTLPDGVTVSKATRMSGLYIDYFTEDGEEELYRPSLGMNSDKTRFIVSTFTELGYTEDGECYGSLKWDPGDYSNMWEMTLVFPAGFTGGEIILYTEPDCTEDTRGPICPKGQENYYTATVTVEGGEPIVTDAPEVVVTPGDDAYIFDVVGPEGAELKLYIDGVEVEIPYTVARTDVDQIVRLTAIAHIEGQTDGSVTGEYLVPALSVPEVRLYIADLEAFHGDTIVVPIQMINEESIMAFQTDIYLPDGFALVTDNDDDLLIVPSSRLTSDHVIMADLLNDGRVRVICYTPRSKLISGNEGDLFYITVVVPMDAGGDYTVSLRNSLLTDIDYRELRVPDDNANFHVKTYTPGDVNDSRTVNVTDIVFTAQYILQRNPSPFIFEAADMNCDGEITVTDIMLIARLIMTPTMNMPKRMHAICANGDGMKADGIAITAGETRRVSIALDNAMDYSAFQFDLKLPDGMSADNFRLTDRAGGHALQMESIGTGKLRALCYSPAIEPIIGNSGALLTFDVTAGSDVKGDILVDGIELVTTECQTVLFEAFTVGVNNMTVVNDLAWGKTISHVDYFNLAGQRIDRPEDGVTLVVTTYIDGTRTTTKIIH